GGGERGRGGDDVAVDGGVGAGAGAARPMEPVRFVLVVGEERPPACLRIEMAGAEPVLEGKVAERLGGAIVGHEADVAGPHVAFAQDGLALRLFAPGPGVPEPEMG